MPEPCQSLKYLPELKKIKFSVSRHNLPSSASRKGCKNRSNSISSIAAITSPALSVFLFDFIAKLFALGSKNIGF